LPAKTAAAESAKTNDLSFMVVPIFGFENMKKAWSQF